MSEAMLVAALGVIPLIIWLHLVFGRGGYWLARERDDRNEPAEPAAWPSVIAVVPARDEADVIARSVGSLLVQDYPGPFRVILVDDQSERRHRRHRRTDRQSLGKDERLEVVGGRPLPSGWTGKLWALSQGVERASAEAAPDYLLLTDADIGHDADNLRHLVARAEAGG